MTKKATPKQDWHRADILAALKKAGLSLRQLGMAHGYSPTSLNNVLDRPWPKAERIVAEVLGVTPESIWPSRYQEKPSPAEVLRELRNTRQFSGLIGTDKSFMTDSQKVA